MLCNDGDNVCLYIGILELDIGIKGLAFFFFFFLPIFLCLVNCYGALWEIAVLDLSDQRS